MSAGGFEEIVFGAVGEEEECVAAGVACSCPKTGLVFWNSLFG